MFPLGHSPQGYPSETYPPYSYLTPPGGYAPPGYPPPGGYPPPYSYLTPSAPPYHSGHGPGIRRLVAGAVADAADLYVDHRYSRGHGPGIRTFLAGFVANAAGDYAAPLRSYSADHPRNGGTDAPRHTGPPRSWNLRELEALRMGWYI